MAIRDICYVMSVNHRRKDGTLAGGNAIRASTDETVFIPASVIKKLDLAEMDEIEAILVKPRDNQTVTTDWTCIKAVLLDEPLS